MNKITNYIYIKGVGNLIFFYMDMLLSPYGFIVLLDHIGLIACPYDKEWVQWHERSILCTHIYHARILLLVSILAAQTARSHKY